MTKEKAKRAPTPRQRKVAVALVKNLLQKEPSPTCQVLESVGYGTGLQNSPHRVLESEGVKIAIAEIGLKEALISQGINPKRIAEKIDVLLNGVDREGNNDYTAIDKGLKHATAIYGITEETKNTTNVYNFVNNPMFLEKIKSYDTNYKNQVLNVQKTQTNEKDMESSK